MKESDLIPFTLKLLLSTSERSEITAYFDSNPALKKGETVKAWVLEKVRAAPVRNFSGALK